MRKLILIVSLVFIGSTQVHAQRLVAKPFKCDLRIDNNPSVITLASVQVDPFEPGSKQPIGQRVRNEKDGLVHRADDQWLRVDFTVLRHIYKGTDLITLEFSGLKKDGSRVTSYAKHLKLPFEIEFDLIKPNHAPSSSDPGNKFIRCY